MPELQTDAVETPSTEPDAPAPDTDTPEEGEKYDGGPIPEVEVENGEE